MLKILIVSLLITFTFPISSFGQYKWMTEDGKLDVSFRVINDKKKSKIEQLDEEGTFSYSGIYDNDRKLDKIIFKNWFDYGLRITLIDLDNSNSSELLFYAKRMIGQYVYKKNNSPYSSFEFTPDAFSISCCGVYKFNIFMFDGDQEVSVTDFIVNVHD